MVLWSYLPTFAGYFKRLGEKLSVFDAVDNWLLNSDFKKFVGKLNRIIKSFGIKADLIFTTAPALVDFSNAIKIVILCPTLLIYQVLIIKF